MLVSRPRRLAGLLAWAFVLCGGNAFAQDAAGAPIDCAPCGAYDAELGCVPETRGCDTKPRGGKISLELDGSASRVSVLVSDPENFGDPRSTAEWTLCLWEKHRSSEAPNLLLQSTVPPGGLCDGVPCWKASSNGYLYENDDLASRGAWEVRAEDQDGHREGFMVWKGEGENLGFPSELPQDLERLSVKLIERDGDSSRCWAHDETLDKLGPTKLKSSFVEPE